MTQTKTLPSLFPFKSWYDQHRAQVKEDYFRFLRFQSISADPQYKQEVLSCAQWLAATLKNGHLNSEILPTSGYPIVYAEDLSAGPHAPTVLIYGHYDVQPIDPIELWESPPFVPTERDGKVFARGAVDDKGQIFYACLAMIAAKSMKRALSVNVKFCIEGEEESQSLGLSRALPSLKDKLRADSLLIVDFSSCPDGAPAVTLGARGIAALEVVLTGSNSDLHSGLYGGLAYNPNRALAELLTKLWDEEGHVTVPGFYSEVTELTQEDLEQYAFPFNKKNLSKEFGIEALGGEKDRTMQEANWLRPTLEINGMCGGYTGAGIKTVIPAHATAKITCRTTPNQNPDTLCHLIADFLKKHVASGMKIDVKIQGGVGAFRANPNSALAKAVRAAAAEVTKIKCVNILSGGSIPIAQELTRTLNAEVVGMGYGLATDEVHAPNEHFDMVRFEKGFLTVARTLELL